MADELGTAVLRLIIDDSAFKDSLNRAKTQIKNELGGAIPTPTAARPTAAPRPAALTRPAINPITGMTTAYETAQRASAELLQNDLERLQIIRQITQRLQEQADIRPGGFGEASRATFGTQDPVEKSIRRNQEKRARDAARAARQEQQAAQQRNALEEDLAQTTARRVSQQERAVNAAKALLADQQKQLAAEKQLTAEAAKRRKENQKLGKELAANALIGAGFPLLFGQGFGAALGGGLGGAAGALGGGTLGFAGSIVGTALGAAFDTALQKAQELARGLDDPIKNFDALRQAALLSSKAVEKNAEALIASGREEEAAALIRADLLKTFGTPEGAAEFTAATDELSRAWSQATVSLTQFVAGPLAKFLRGVSLFLGGGEAANAAADVRRAQELARSSPERRQQLEQLARQSGGRLTEELKIAGAPSVPVFREFLQLNGQLTQEQRNQKELTDAMSSAYERTVQFNRLNLDLINASARGNELEANSIEKKLVALERTRKLNTLSATAPQAQRDQIEQETAAKLADLEAKRVGIQDRINAEAFSELQARQQIQRSVSNTLQLLGAQSGQYRDTLRTVQQISGTIDEARQKEAKIGFEIGQARIAGREQEASRLVDQQVTAAAETRQRLVEGALALTEAGDKLRNDVRDAALNLAKVRGSEQGLNRFLSTGLQQQRAEQTNRLLQPFFQEAVGRLRQLVPNADISGFQLTGATTADLNKNIIDFIQAVNEEFNATQNFANAQQSLQQVNQALVDINSQLVGATNALAAKDWVVAVNVVNQAGGASTINTVNSLS